MTDAPALEFRSVGYVAGGTRVLDAIDFALAPGDSLAIVGDSGSGKSMLARLAAGLLPPTDGEVLVFGRSGTAERRNQSNRVGVTLQGGSLFEDLSIEDNLRLSVGVTGNATWRAHAARVDRLLYDFGLETMTDVRVAQLATGARRKLEIVRALVREPQLLILDEPFEGAAAHTAATANAISRAMRRQGGATLCISQDAELARLLSPNILFLSHGRLAQQSEVVSRSEATSDASSSTRDAMLSPNAAALAPPPSAAIGVERQ